MIKIKFVNIKHFTLFLMLSVSVLAHKTILAQNHTLEIDIATEFQTIDNFGASDCWSFQMLGGWFTPKKEEIADLLFSTENGIGLSAWRFNIGGGKLGNRISHPWRSVETFEVSEGVYDWTKQANETWFLNAAKDRGVDQFIAFVNSPPARMTKSGFTNCDNGLGSTNLKNGYETQFATYLADVLIHFRDSVGIDFNYVSPINEPQWEWNESNQEGNRASNDDIKSVVNSLYDVLQSKNIDTDILVTESGDIPSWHSESGISQEYGKTYGKYLTELYSDESINSKISNVIGGHSYWSDLVDTKLIQDRIAFKIRLLSYFDKGWKYWMTEYCQLQGPNNEGGNGRDLTMETALNIARVIHFDLTVTNASAWQWWTAVSPEDYKDGLIYTNYFSPGDNQTIIESKTLWALGNYSRFIRPGSKRVECFGAADKHDLMASAYTDSANGNLIIVAVNVTDNEKNINFDITGHHSDMELVPYVTSDNLGHDLKMGSSFKVDIGYNMPAKSVVTFIGKLDKITSVEETTESSSSSNSLNIFPNPFNPSTKINYELSKKSKVKIEIFDLRGNKIHTLVNSEKPLGSYTVEFSPKGLPSGIYLARMDSGGEFNSIKMIYLK